MNRIEKVVLYILLNIIIYLIFSRKFLGFLTLLILGRVHSDNIVTVLLTVVLTTLVVKYIHWKEKKYKKYNTKDSIDFRELH